MSSFLGVTLSNCYIDIQRRLDVEKVVNDIVNVVEIHSMEESLISLRRSLQKSNDLIHVLELQTSQLLTEKETTDSEFERIRSEAVKVREVLLHNVVSIISQSKQSEMLCKKNRDLEESGFDIVNLVSADVAPPADAQSAYDAGTTESASSYVFSASSAVEIKSVHIEKDASAHVASKKCPKLIGDLEDKLLLLCVSFLDVSEVLIVAQINRRLFARLDQLFQNGSTIPNASWLICLQDSSSVSSASRGTSSEVLDALSHDTEPCDNESPKLSNAAGKVLTSPGVASAADETPNGTAKIPAGEGRYFGKFSMLLAAADNLLPNALTNSVMNAVGASRVVPSSPAGGANSNTDNIVKTPLQTKNGATNGNGTTHTPINNIPSVSPVAVPSSAGGLTREIAESLCKKLTAAETKAIINMDDLLKKCTIKLELSMAENEDLTSKLQGILSTRDFLIDKLKGAEIALKASMNQCATLTKQSRADDEIIHYLDLRSQQFEGKNADLVLKTEQLQSAYSLQCGSYSHRENQLFSELAEYKTKYEELEINYKSHKRILVKEVKALRSQVGTMTVERNKHIAQMLTVKKVLSSGNNA